MYHRQSMAYTLGALALIAAGLLVALPSSAATTYPFLVRGQVYQVNKTQKIIKVTTTFASVKAQSDVIQKIVDYDLKDAAVYKYVDGVKTLASVNELAVKQEVVMKGNKLSNGKFDVDWAVINETGFTGVGRVLSKDDSAKTITVTIGNSTYKPKTFAGKHVVLQYTDSTTFKRLGTKISGSQVPVNKQLVKFKGYTNQDTSRWQLTDFWDNYR